VQALHDKFESDTTVLVVTLGEGAVAFRDAVTRGKDAYGACIIGGRFERNESTPRTKEEAEARGAAADLGR
jgi:hypothetical protein